MKKIFILGNPRSGTSLLRIMLNCHPEIAAPPECGFLQWWFSKYTNWTDKDIFNGRIDDYLTDLFSSRKFETWSVDKFQFKKHLIKEQPSNYTELTTEVYKFWGKKSTTIPQVIIDKNNYYIHHLNELKQVWPDAGYILLIRDGRDVACSYKRMQELDTDSPYKPNLSNEIDIIAKEWKGNNERIISFLEKVHSKKYISVRYEDLIEQSQRVLRDICHFLGLKYNSQMLNYYKRNQADEIEPKETLDWKKKTLRKPDKRNVGKYKDILEEEDIRVFNDIAGRTLKRFNYSS